MKKLFSLLLIITLAVMVFPASARTIESPTTAPAPQEIPTAGAIQVADDSQTEAKSSHRLIVELESPPLAVYARQTGEALTESGKLDFNAPAAKDYLNALAAEQAAFVSAMNAALPEAQVGYYINEMGADVALTYQVAFNGLTVDPGSTDKALARKQLAALPGVKAVYLDFAHQPELYASLPLINAGAAYANPAIGGKANAGAGIKVASMDGGVHHEAPMFDGAGFSYPPGYPPNGLGLTANNNGKIIASRVYFRPWDPPSAGDENPWPGVNGTPHGTHTASTAAGNEVVAEYLGITETISGVAPAAWVMSYRVFYNSITNDGSFYNAEGIAALEDILMDGADVLNNSWGGGPGSLGGEFDPLDQALINVASAGTFISMSAGNAGPNKGTTDHPSDDYISVAASSTEGTFASGRLNITAPEPISPTLQGISYAGSNFGAPLPIGTVISHTYTSAINVNPANFEGCNPWPANTFDGMAVLISRGACEFGVKVLNAEQAGADFVVVYNHAAGGDTLVSMSPGAVGNLVTIPSIFIGHDDGLGVVAWETTYGAASVLEIDTFAFQAGNTPDVLASFSSRGPGVGNVLKPDITAPGVNILAQGYKPGASGEERHLGFGQVSGTSMAAPHVAGSAALLRQIHPDWSNAEIKSALMSTSKYVGIWNNDGSHAQPLDMGAGRLDLTNAADPGVILDPPSLSFGQMVTGTMESMNVWVTSVASTTQSYTLTLQHVSGTYMTPTIGTLPGFSASPAVLSLDPGETEMVTVTFDSNAGMIGDNQGHLLFDGADYDPHMPAWARVMPPPTSDILIIDNDGSSSLGFDDYTAYYTDALDNLGLNYDVLDTDASAGAVLNFLPPAVDLNTYKAVIYFTGDNFYPDGFFTVPTPLTQQDQDRLTQYANNGGIILAMGQDLSAVTGSDATDDNTFFYGNVLGGNFLQDSVTGFSLPSAPIIPTSGAPAALQGVTLNLGGHSSALVTLTGANEVPPQATTMKGEAMFAYNIVEGVLDYNVTVMVSSDVTVTASHIHTGAAGMNGGVLYPLWTTPTLVTDTLNFAGSLNIDPGDEAALLAGDTYINVHTNNVPSGEIRAQVEVAVNGDGAANQYYIDELETMPHYRDYDPGPGKHFPFTALMEYPGPYAIENNTVAMAHREQPNLEFPGVSYLGRSIYTSFGLEGVNNGTGGTSREALMDAFLNWAMDEPVVTIADVTPDNASALKMFSASLTSNITGTVGTSYRWDFGDGSAYEGPYESDTVGHEYTTCGLFTVRVEAVDSWGNHAVGELDVLVDKCANHLRFFPIMMK